MTLEHGALRDRDVTSVPRLADPADRVPVRLTSPSRPLTSEAINKKLDGLARELGRQVARDVMSRGRSIWEIAAFLALAVLLVAAVLWLQR